MKDGQKMDMHMVIRVESHVCLIVYTLKAIFGMKFFQNMSKLGGSFFLALLEVSCWRRARALSSMSKYMSHVGLRSTCTLSSMVKPGLVVAAWSPA